MRRPIAVTLLSLCPMMPAVAQADVERAAEAYAGALTRDDDTLASGEFVDVYRFELAAGERAVFELLAEDFDGYLILRTPGGRQYENDDVEDEPGVSRIPWTAADAGVHEVYVTSYAVGETGMYRLGVTRASARSPSVESGHGGAMAWPSDWPAALSLTRQTLDDPSAGTPVSHPLVPEGWRLAGGAAWDLEQRPFVTLDWRVTSPGGRYAVWGQPTPLHRAYSDQQVAMMRQTGIAIPQQEPPVSAAEYVTRYLPRARPELRGARVVDAEALPGLAAATADDGRARLGEQIAGMTFDAARVRVAYDTPAGPMEEDVIVTLCYIGVDVMVWGPCSVTSLIAPADEMDAAAPVLGMIAGSAQVTPQWQLAVDEVGRILHESDLHVLQEINRRGELARQTQAAINAMNRESFAFAMETRDRRSREIADTLRGARSSTNPHTGQSQYVPPGMTVGYASNGQTYVGPPGATLPPGFEAG